MSDCANANVRDLLPDLLHDQLDAALRVEVESHLAGCESCRDELTLLRSIHLTLRNERVRVDVAAIVAALPAPTARPDPKIVSLASRRRHFADWRVAAAAALLIAGGASMAVLRGRTHPFAPAVAVQTAATTTRGSAPLSPEAATSAVAATVAAQPAKPDAKAASTPREVERVAEVPGELAVNAGISDLSNDELRSLIGTLDRIEAVPAAEPEQNPVRLPNDPGATP